LYEEKKVIKTRSVVLTKKISNELYNNSETERYSKWFEINIVFKVLS